MNYLVALLTVDKNQDEGDEMETSVISCKQNGASGDVFLLNLKLEKGTEFNAGPGQFVVLEAKNNRSVMPRPFSIVNFENGVVSLLIKVIGKNTKAYSQLKRGDQINLFGPQGAVIPIEEKTKSYILLGGGIGGAALILFAKELDRQNIPFVVLLGAKDKGQISGIDFFKRYNIQIETIVDTGEGRVGFATDLLEEYLKDDDGLSTIITCGPKLMLKKVAELSKKHGNKCIVMVEELMACSMGSCKGCKIFCKDGTYKNVCSDGPAFDAEIIDLEKFVPESRVQIIEKVSPNKVDMMTSLCGIPLEYPTMNSSGCLSVDALEKGYFDYSKLGALVTKGVTVLPRAGNAMPRTCETASGMINSIGLENVGIEKFLADELPRWLKLGKPVIVNISGFSVEEFSELARKLSETDIAGIEVNISCPNLKHGGISFGVNAQLAAQVTLAVRSVTDKPVIVKLTPNVTDIVSMAQSVVDSGADVISLVNTFLAMSIDPLTRKPKIGAVMGGLSGPGIRPIAVRMVHQISLAKLGVPIIGMGGIENSNDAAEFIIAGANVIAAGTGGFRNRQVFTDINSGLKKIISSNGFSSIGDLVGSIVLN